MLGLTMNPDAEKIVKAAAREAGFAGAVSVVSAANGARNPMARRRRRRRSERQWLGVCRPKRWRIRW